MTPEEILQHLYDETLKGNAPEVLDLTHQALALDMEPQSLLFDALIPSLEEVGARFERGDFFVPEMLIAGRAMAGAMEVLRPLLADTGVQTIGKFLMGTVKGDVHDIGKNLVNIMLEGAGFEVIDLGVQVAPEKFVEKIQEHQPDIVGFSAFLTTTMPMFKANLNALEKAGLRDQVIVMVGGAPGHPGVRRRGRRRRLRPRRVADRQAGQGPAAEEASAGLRMSTGPLLETTLRGTGAEVVLGHGRRFCLIGERINPTGRRIFQEQLRAGDLSAIERDVIAQVEGGADVLDVNMGVPMTDEPELLAKAITLVQELTDKPICIDSSVVEALEAGLAAYEGRALVNSVTAEDDRMALILPLVKKYDAAIIALPNDAEEIPMEADRRLELVQHIVDVATTEYGIALEDIVIDPLAMPIGADTGVVNTTLDTMRRIRDVHGLNMTCGASNVSFGMPDRHTLGAAFLPMAMTAGLTSAIMDTRTPQIVEAVKAADLLLGHDEWGGSWIAAHRQEAGRRRRDDARHHGPAARRRRSTTLRREGLIEPPDGPGSQPARRLRPGAAGLHRRPGATCAVPPGVSVFDAASWNGIAIDSTCGGHGTCKKCKVQVLDGSVPVHRLDARSFTPRAARRRLAAGLPGPGDRGPRGRGAAADHPAQGGHRRRRPSGDPAAGGPEALRRARRADPRRTSAPTSTRLLDAIDDLELTRRPARAAPAARRCCAQADFKVTAVVVDDVLIDVEPGDTTGRALRDRVRPRHHHRRGHAARHRDRHARSRSRRCSTSSSRSAPT